MKNKLVIISTVLIFFLIFSVDGQIDVTDYTLQSNITFEDWDISDLNTTGTWTIESTGCHRGTNCLKGENGNIWRTAYVANSSFLYNTTTTNIIIKGWVEELTTNDVDRSFFMWNHRNEDNYEAMGLMWVDSNDDYRLSTHQRAAGSDSAENGAIVDITGFDSQWLVLNISENKTEGWVYDTSAESTLRYNLNYTFEFNSDGGYIGFNNKRDTLYDDIEIWQFIPPPPSSNRSFTLSTNLTDNATSPNNPFTFNISAAGAVVNTTTSSWTIKVYLNDTLNQTHYSTVNLNVSDIILNLTYAPEQIAYDINVTVNNTEAIDSFVRTSVLLDNVVPDLNITTDFVNDSQYWRYVDPVSFSMTCQDPNLFACNVSVFYLNQDGSINETKNNTFVDNINTTSYTINYDGSKELDPETLLWDNGRYMIRGTGWDSHTDNKVKPPQWFTQPDTINIDNDIKLEGDIKEERTEFLLSPLGDRYKFKITWENDALEHQLIISTNENKIIYRPDDGYQGHFVILGLNRWIDFESDNIANVEVTRLDNNRYLLDITLKTISDEVEFESIGDLNTIIEQWFFNLTDGFRILAINGFNSSTVNNFTVSLYSGSTEIQTKNTGAGQLGFNLTTGTYTTNISAPGYLANNTPLTLTTNGSFTYHIYQAGFYDVNFTGYYQYADINYTRNITSKTLLSCANGTTATLERYINGISNLTYSLTCNGGNDGPTDRFAYLPEGQYNISFLLNATINTMSGNATFTSDIYNPTVTSIVNVTTGFVEPVTNLTLTCTDNIFLGNLTYNKTFNTAEFLHTNLTNATIHTNVTSSPDGSNTYITSCSDPFGTNYETTTYTVYYQSTALIDERTNEPFNLDNVTTAIVYFDDNSTSYDFKTTNDPNVNFTSLDTDQLRFELRYSDGTLITRYVDVSLLTDDDLRVCANKEGVTHYEQLLLSASEKPVVLKSVFANCIIAADYTRFAYQDTKVLKAYTIQTAYYLYTWQDNDITKTQSILAGVDGSIASFINLDTLEFQEQGYNINVAGDSLKVQNLNSNEVLILYYNAKQDNTALRMTILRTDTNTLLFNSSSFSDANEATITFNFGNLTNVNKTTLFKVTALKTTSSGTSEIIEYFNVNGSTGFLPAGAVFFLGILMIIFGLTFTATQSALGWFGIIIIVFNIIFLSFATATWYITFLQGINFIVIVFIALTLIGKNQAGVTA